MKLIKLLYVYEERVPLLLRELVLSHIPLDEFEVDTMTYETESSSQKQKFSWADVVLFAPGRFLPDEVMEAAKNVKLMQLWSSGYDKFNIASAKKYGIPVANNGGANACSVAEHTILLMLAVYKWLPDSHRRTVQGSWSGNSHGLDMFLLNGKKLGIIGFGNIGRQVARKVSGFDMDVKYYDINRLDSEKEKELGVSFAPFDQIISESDILSLHLHSNDKTNGIIGNEEISKMKKGSVIINVSRAALINQEALYEALATGKIHGAGLDVYNIEPTVPNDKMLLLPNVVATPHMAGSTYDTYSMVMNRAVENFRRVCSGESPKWVINQ